MVQCVAFNCNARSQKGVSMYLFPKDPKFRKLWVRNLRRDRFKVTQNSKLCADHFTGDQFLIHPTLAKKCGYKKMDLRPDAVPTIFDYGPTTSSSKTGKTFKVSTAFFKRRMIEALGKTADDEADDEVIEDDTATQPTVNMFDNTDTSPCITEAKVATCGQESNTDLINKAAITTFNAFTQTSTSHCHKIKTS